MSIRSRRNSLLKSSISIKSMRDTVSNFTSGITNARKTATELVKKTRESNIFKKRLIRSDNEFFSRRRENVRRKEREDELEAASVTGVVKKRGTVTATSTKGFLGRILDFFGIILIGWFVTRLPKILDAIGKVITRIRQLVGVLSGFVEGVTDILVSMKRAIRGAIDALPSFDFLKAKKQSEEEIEKTENSLVLMQRDLVSSANEATNPKNIGLTSFNEDAISLTDVQNDNNNNQNLDTPSEDTTKTENKKTEDKDTENEQKTEVVNPVDTKLGLNDSNSVEGENVMGDTLLAKLDETKKKSKGDTIDVKNQEETDQKLEQENKEGIRTKINNYISNMFGTKAEKDTENQKIASTKKFDIRDNFETVSDENFKKELESATEKFSSKVDVTDIVSLKKSESNVQLDNRKKKNTIMIVEKPVRVGSNQGVMLSSSKSKLDNIDFSNMNDSETMKKIQTIILNT
tara:strand:+ start:1056 stop:2438 length:1383 start_codon:yes stop_codon:yes gene_type:complete